MKPLEFNSIFVIESLRPADTKTGTLLFEDTIKRQLMLKGMADACHLFSIETKKDFFSALEHITQHVTYNFVSPIIHIEMHGSETGLQTTNLETITWEELQMKLIEMNFICENNLFLTMATCHGGYIYKAISPRLRTPFWGFVGPFETVSEGEVLANFTSFYEEFIQSLDFNLAEKALNQSNSTLVSKFRFQNTEFIFNKAYYNYETKHLTPAKVEHRTNLIVAQCKDLPEFKSWTKEKIKEHAKTLMVDNGEKLKEDLMTKFFLWDIFPHHRPTIK